MRRAENGQVYDFMITLKYQKKDEARFISHIDLLRHVSRILLRAEIPVRRSNGFNPHSLVFFSPPLCLGATSLAEYLVIDTPMSAGEAMTRFNASAQKGLWAVEAFECEKNPNLQARIEAADYIYPYPYRDLDLSHLTVEYVKKGETVKEDVSGKLFGTFCADGKLGVKMATGGNNLRPDRLLGALADIYGAGASVTDVVKIAQYERVDGEFVDVDNILR